MLMAYFPLLLQQMVPLFAYGSEAAEFILAVSGPKLDLYSAYPNKVKPFSSCYRKGCHIRFRARGSGYREIVLFS